MSKRPLPPEFPKFRNPTLNESAAFDTDGQPIPMSPHQVTAHVRRMVEDGGDIVAAIIRSKDGDIGVQAFGPPSQELLDILETAVAAFRKILQGHA